MEGMMSTGLTASDVALLNDRRDGGWGDGSFMWIFALLILAGGGGLFGNNRGQAVTEADLCSANSFSELKGSVGRLSDQVGGAYTGLQNGICNLGYEMASQFNSLERQLADCCCTTQRAIDGVNFNLANSTAAINANTSAGIQKILDKMCETEAARQTQRIQQLELQQALCGVVRYPNAMTYNAGYSPFCGNTGCGGYQI